MATRFLSASETNLQIELLDKKLIEKYLAPKHYNHLQSMLIIDQINSTNSHLSELAKDPKNKINICLAECQTAGKGRLDRKWVSPYARNIYLSILWKFHQPAANLSGLSIAVAIGAIEALQDYGIKEKLMLKWPNDILWNQRKLSGILIEFLAEAPNIYSAVIGIGINVNMPKEAEREINQPWCDIAQITNSVPSRNKLAGILISKILDTLEIYQQQGFKPFVKKWEELDICHQKHVNIITPTEIISGTGKGIDDHGCFLLQKDDGKIQTFAAGEVSLKFQ